jgi:hypothetical protein
VKDGICLDILVITGDNFSVINYRGADFFIYVSLARTTERGGNRCLSAGAN